MSRDLLCLVLALAPGVQLVELLREVVADAAEDLGDAPDFDDIMNQGFSVCWQSEKDGRLCRVVLDLDELSADPAERETFADGFVSRMVADTDRIEYCVRFHDVRILARNRELADEIFRLEMRIREALTLMIASAGAYASIANLVSEGSVNPKECPSAEGLRKPHAENELFYLLFSDYWLVNSARRRDLGSIVAAIASHRSFEEFRSFVTRSEIIDNEDLKTFVAQLKDLMDPIEKVRNCVAHNRVVRERLLGNYETARAKLEVVLDEAFGRFI